MSNIEILVAVSEADAARYYRNLSQHLEFNVNIVHSHQDARAVIGDRNQRTDVLVIENQMGEVYHFISEIRQSYPRLLIVLVDEDADFGMPGQADEFSTEPFKNDDLANRIKRMMSDRQMETLRSDSLPAVRNVAKNLRAATGLLGKQQAGARAALELGYDYTAYYHKISNQPLQLAIKAQEGAAVITSIAPKDASSDDLMGWVQQNGQSRIAAPEDRPNHPLVARGRLGAVACVPVTFNGLTYGVLVACRDRPGSITQENVLMLELVGSQLAAAISKEMR